MKGLLLNLLYDVKFPFFIYPSGSVMSSACSVAKFFLSSHYHFKQTCLSMRCYAFMLLLLTILVSCSKKDKPERTNFAELTIDNHKIVFDSLEAVFDTSTERITCNFIFFDRLSNSNMDLETISGSKLINGTYEYPGEQFPGQSIVYLGLHTYVNQLPGTYDVEHNNLFSLNIYQSGNGRMRGRFSGKLNCYSCMTSGTDVSVTG